MRWFSSTRSGARVLKFLPDSVPHCFFSINYCVHTFRSEYTGAQYTQSTTDRQAYRAFAVIGSLGAHDHQQNYQQQPQDKHREAVCGPQ